MGVRNILQKFRGGQEKSLSVEESIIELSSKIKSKARYATGYTYNEDSLQNAKVSITYEEHRIIITISNIEGSSTFRLT